MPEDTSPFSRRQIVLGAPRAPQVLGPAASPLASVEIVPLGEVVEGEVLEALQVLEVDAASPRDILDAFAQFLRLDVANGDATPDTIAAYQREVVMWVKWCQARDIVPQDARRSDIVAYREDLKRQGISVTTRSHKLSIVRRFYEAAVQAGLIAGNPASGVKGGKDLTPGEEKIKALTHNALARLAESIPQDTFLGRRDRAIIALMAVHGLRRVEVARLDEASLEEDGVTASLVVHGKGGRIRRVFLRADTFAVLHSYLSAKREAGYESVGPLFVSHSNRSRGARISRRSLNDIVDGYLSGAALKKSGVSCHALRHTFGTLAVAGGAKVEHLRDAMGHSRLETTGLYVKAIERVKNNPANFIDVEF